MVEVKKILFPWDFTQASLKVIPHLITAAEKYGAQVLLLHVVDDLEGWGGVYVPFARRDDIVRDAIRGAEKYINQMCLEHMKECPDFERRVVTGDPAKTILETIQSEGIDLVIMGTHSRKGLDRALFGSVADKVSKKSPVPVMVINPEKV